jgi:hypothetical protein
MRRRTEFKKTVVMLQLMCTILDYLFRSEVREYQNFIRIPIPKGKKLISYTSTILDTNSINKNVDVSFEREKKHLMVKIAF